MTSTMPHSADSAASPEAPEAPSEVTDEELVERVLHGELAHFELLMRRHNQRLFRVVRSIISDDVEAEDVVQDAYVRAYSHLDQFEGRAAFGTWLTRIAVHEARARIRKAGRFTPLEAVTGPRAETEIPDSNGGSSGPEDDASSRELQRVLTRAIDALPDSHRSVFVLREVEGLSTAETAEVLDLSEANVKVRLHRARTRLRADIDRRLGTAARKLFAFAGHRCDRTVAAVLERISSLD